MEKLDPCEGDRESHRDLDYLDEDGVDDLDRPRERERHSSASEGESGGQDGGSDCENLASESGPSGVQVTIRADGERAVNSDGHVRRVAGRLFVELRCPYCRNQKSITFKEYKMHLVSPEHKAQLDRLANRHAQVLRKMRIQQRQEQKEIEDKWREENPEEFKNTISRFCKSCSLAFKCLRRNSNEGLSLHNRSKFHKMQRHYIHPRCGLCHIGFPSRMDYKRHLASIYHLRVRASNIDNQGRSQQPEDHAHKDEGSDLDLDNFMTLDSVGEDDENNGSEHEEITGDLDATEAQEKERAGAEDGDEDDLESVSAHSNTDKPSPASKEEKDAFHCKQRDKALHRGEEEEEEEEEDNTLEADWEKDQPEDEEEEGHQSLGTEYVRRIEAYYCSLCDKIIRANSSLGSRAVQRHCRSFSHLSHYRDHHPAPHQDEDGLSGEDGEGEDLQEDPHQAKLWEEVDKGLTALQGEILTEIENEDAIEGNKEANEVKKEGNESQEEDMEDSKVESNVTESLKEQRVGNGNMGSDSNAEDWEEAGEDITA